MKRFVAYARVATKSQITEIKPEQYEKKALIDRMFSEMKQSRMNRIDIQMREYQRKHGCKVV